MIEDLRFAIRTLAKDRRFTIAAVVALALGIGVNNSVFALIDAAVLRDVPFEQGGRLVAIRSIDARGEEGGVSLLDLRDWQAAARAFEGFGADAGGVFNLSDANRAPERLRGSYITANTFGLLRSRPLLGRDFIAEDERRGAIPVAIIGHGVWIDRYGSDPSVIGRTVKINDVPATIVGVMPRDFKFPGITQIWQPLSQSPSIAAADPPRGMRNLNVFARLAPGVDRAQAQAELDTIAARLAAQYPATNKDVRVRLQGMKDAIARFAWPMLMTMMAAVAVVMLVACANLANLLLARSAYRGREIAIRAALGASRWRIARQLLIECAVLAMLGGVIGLALSYVGVRQIAIGFDALEAGSTGTATRPYWLNLTMSGSVYAFVAALCVIATFAFGMIPAWHISKANAQDALKDGGRTMSSARARHWTTALMIGELAMTLTLLACAGLLWRNFATLYQRDAVVRTDDVVIMQVALPVQKYRTPEQRQEFFARLDARLSAIPAIASASLSSHSPLLGFGGPGRRLAVDGRASDPAVEPPPVTFVYAGTRYFETVGLAARRGRVLDRRDAMSGAEGALVNQRFVDLFFQGEEVIGRRIQLTTASTPALSSPWLTVVGVVATIPNLGSTPRASDAPVVYAPMSIDQSPRAATIIVRAGAGGVSAVAPLLRDEVRALDADLPLFGIEPVKNAVARARYPVRMVGTWIGVLALIALIVAAVGLFALTAHGVAQRTQEVGVRMALGATDRAVVWMFARRTVVQLAIGLAIGLAGALGAGRLFQSYLGHTSPRDPLTIAIVVLLLACVAVCATWLPARRATRIDSAVALRAE